MDAHYESQIKSYSQTNFCGPARQMGAGGGLGAFAVRMGRVAIPLVKKYVLPVAKQVGKNLLETAIPEIGQVLTGKRKPSRKLFQHVARNTAKKTLQSKLPPPPPSDGRAAGAARRTKREAVPVKTTRKRTNSSNISRKSTAKRSRSDILSEIQFTN